jgi:putative phosphoribosyl transferase
VDDRPFAPPLFHDRAAAGRALARDLVHVPRDAVVVGLARGGIAVAAEAAGHLGLPLDAVAVRKVGHLFRPERAIGAVAPGGVVHVRPPDGMTEEQVRAAVAGAATRASQLDRRLHAERPPLPLAGRPCVLVDDGLATGATMLAAVRWARARAAAPVVVAVPVAAAAAVPAVAGEADELVCPHVLDPFLAVGLWYASFEEVRDAVLTRLLRQPVADVVLTA